MKKITNILTSTLFFAVLCGCTGTPKGQTVVYDLTCDDLVVRDPYIFVDKASGKYYVQANIGIFAPKPTKANVAAYDGIYCYESRDLKHWRLVGKSFTPPKDWWGQKNFWAPDMFKVGNKYYILSTFSSLTKEVSWKFDGKIKMRACAALVADKPEGPYKPVADKPLTPEDWMSLDGTLYEEDGKMYLIFCHEWVQVGNGEIVAVEISKDLSKPIGKPFVLFKASDAPWARDLQWKPGGNFVTDAGVINRAEDGTLYMTWSSFANFGDKQKYVIGVAISDNGKLNGKWKHLPDPLNTDDGGHAMIFKTLCGKQKISYHAPNSVPLGEKTVIKNFKFENGKAVISE